MEKNPFNFSQAQFHPKYFRLLWVNITSLFTVGIIFASKIAFSANKNVWCFSRSGPGGDRRGRVPRGTRVSGDGTRQRRSDGPGRGGRFDGGAGNFNLARAAQKRERELVTSEFGSGLPSKRSRKN